MRIEAVTVCVHYADFLAVAARHNAHVFDRWLVVTSEADKETRQVCRRFNLDCLVSEDHKRDDADFAKGRLIERGLLQLASDSWRVHIDADIVLPTRTRHSLEAAHLDEKNIYGADRVMVRSYEDWLKLERSGWLQEHHNYHCSVNPPKGFELGTRWASPVQGWLPIGYFQLWHSDADLWSGIRARPYPLRHGEACRTDVQHGLQWDRRNRVLIPELFLVHLESEKAGNGANWNGRTTKRFGPGPAIPPQGKARSHSGVS